MMPNARERKALDALRYQEWETRAQLYIGEVTFQSLIEKGWIAPFQGYDFHGDCFSITEAGIAACDLPELPKARGRARLAQLTPRLPMLPDRLKR